MSGASKCKQSCKTVLDVNRLACKSVPELYKHEKELSNVTSLYVNIWEVHKLIC